MLFLGIIFSIVREIDVSCLPLLVLSSLILGVPHKERSQTKIMKTKPTTAHTRREAATITNYLISQIYPKNLFSFKPYGK
jgi:hypothetical protein